MNSYFIVTFMDGNVISSEFSEWTDYSIKKRVNKGTGFKMAYVSMFPVKHIERG